MSNFYSQQGSGAGSNGSNGFYNSSGFGQQQQQQQQGFQQWQAPAPASSGKFHPNAQSGGYSQQQQQQIRQQQQQDPTPFWNQAAAAAFAGVAAQAATGNITNDAMLDWAMKGGDVAWKSGGADMIPGVTQAMLSLRTYFAVDNHYVVDKMKKVLFPFRTSHWKRMENEAAGGPDMIVYMLPHSDENAPDLYIPAMSLVSYCLLCALCYGTSGQFDPEVIPDVTTKCFITQVLEVIVIRIGLYAMQVSVPILDLFSYTGYKYLGLCINMLVGLLMGHLGYGATGYYVTFLWTASAATFFMHRTMEHNTPENVSASGPKRNIMVLAFAGSQALTMWFVGQTKFL